MATTGKRLKDFDAAGLVSDSDIFFVAQGGLEKKMSAAQFKAYCVGNGNGTPAVGISSSVVTYQASSSGTAAPTGTWTNSIPSVTKGQFLWTRTVFTMTDASTATTYSAAYQGADGTNGTNGLGIASAAVTYQTSTSGTTVPTGTWSASVPAVTQGQFLWTRTVTTYTDASTSTAYSVAYQGADAATSNIWFKQSGISVVHNASEGLSTTFNLLSLVIPANTMGPQGLLEFLPSLSMTDTSNAKTITIAIGGVTLWLYANGAGSTSFDSYIQIQNANSQTANMVRASNNNAPFQTGIIGMQQTAIDFTQDQTLTVTCSFAAGSTANTVTLNHWHVRVWNP